MATGEAAHAAGSWEHGLENTWGIVTTKVAMKIDPGGIRKVC